MGCSGVGGEDNGSEGQRDPGGELGGPEGDQVGGGGGVVVGLGGRGPRHGTQGEDPGCGWGKSQRNGRSEEAGGEGAEGRGRGRSPGRP